MERHPEYASENEYLQDVLTYLRGYHKEVAGKKNEIDELVKYSLKHYNSDNAEQFTELTYNLYHQETFNRKANETNYALNKPYFARVDFTPDEGPDLTHSGRYYIGKMTLMRDLDILITDWRAPVSSLYYEGRIGRAAYESPDGEISGEITLKRQYTIEKGLLDGITDIDITTNDAFLQAALGASKDRRLRDIVTTIQAEQNRVIRAPLFTPLIVQGVAGGGKTTIALHRIAYLLYAYEKQLRPRHVMIMAPNRFFLSYISDVLPDLGVERVTQTTFEDFTAECIELNRKQWHINPSSNVIADAVENRRPHDTAMEAACLKGDLRFMKVIKRYCRLLEKRSVPDKDFALDGYELFTHEAITDLFLREYAYLPVARRAAEIKKHLHSTLRKEKPLIIQSIEANCDLRREQLKRVMEDSPERRTMIIALCNERDEKIKRVKNKSKDIIRQYMKAFDIAPVLEHYRVLYEKPNLLRRLSEGLFTAEECALLTSHTAIVLAASALDTEDLPPVLLMQMKLFGLDDTVDIKHVVIDEAQDFSLFQFAVLKALTNNASFSILGDLHQGIYAYKGVRDWEAVRRLIFPKGSDFMTLEQSYRTTVEVMEAANTVISRLYGGAPPQVPLAQPVIRHGEPVTLRVMADWPAAARAIDKKIADCRKAGHRSIAVIGKTLSECNTLKTLLNEKPPLITGLEEHYKGGLLLLPSYLVKGLEFDAVIIANASEDAYRAEDLDIKLLYVAMTRALHELSLFAIGEPSGLVSHLL